MKTEQQKNKINRRDFLRTSSGVALFIGASGILPQFSACSNDGSLLEPPLVSESINAWVKIAFDGTITIFNPAAEMGQGSMTSLPVIFAEEFDADWSMVKVEFSPQESDIYGSEGWGPNRRIMLSAGSRVTKGYYALLRRAAAQARYIMMHNAARRWDLSIKELSTSPSVVKHAASERSISYAEIARDLKMPDEIPDFSVDQLKSPRDFRLIGIDQPRTDIPSKVNGTALFSMDIFLPDMLYGVIERGRVHDASPVLNNEADIGAMAGVVKIVRLDHGIGIIASTLEAALAARKALDIEWGPSDMSGFNSDQSFKTYERIADSKKEGRVVSEIGNPLSDLRRASRIYEADYRNDYVYHAQMEPLNSVVKVSDDGLHAEAWVGSQQGFDSKLGIPEALGIEPQNVQIHLQYLGGGFGRRSMTDFVTESALLAREVAPRPVKLIWTREDDLTYGAYRPMSLQRLRAGVNQKGEMTSLSHVLVGDGDNLIASGIKNEFYDIPHQRAELRKTAHGVRLKHWRAVGHGPNKFAIESMIDQVARGEKLDPVALRRRLMHQSPRALATLEEVVKMSNWNGPVPEGRARGFAFLERSGTLSSGVCEISLDRQTGKIKVHHFWSAHDAGMVIQPDNVRAQIEGGIIMGMSSVLKERLSIVEGKVVQSNFHDYNLLRMEDIPESIETHVLPSGASPEGVGESGTPLVACAVANAFLALTGKPLRHLPFTPDRVREVLA